MDKNLKARRVKSYFLESAREIILTQGVEGISIREIAEKTGYSYATIYSYFENLDDLLFQTKTMMIKDLTLYMNGIKKGEETGLEAIKKTNRAYAEYFLEHPHVYHFLFSHRLEKQFSPEVLNPEAHWYETYEYLIEDGTLRAEDVSMAAKTIIYSMQGLLSLYYSNNGLSKEDFLKDLDALADFVILRGKTG